ncbi:MAG: hypothetical protein FWG11_08890, partial [Promicromonosporaceae bacterium]|nr:hypothetical protein [Promicromonosporaceae bacterium]
MSSSAFIVSAGRAIRGSLGRFLAIAGIIALGVGFLAGLWSTEPSMIHTGRGQVAAQRLFDLRLLSETGFTEADLSAFADTPGVRAAAGSISLDAIVQTDLTDAGGAAGLTDIGTETTVVVSTLTPGINEVTLTAGAMPVGPGEVLLDDVAFSAAMIGTTLTLSPDNPADVLAAFGAPELQVTGLGRSIQYANRERGSAVPGRGRVSAFVFTPRETYHLPVYTEAFLLLDGAPEPFTDEYAAWVGQQA